MCLCNQSELFEYGIGYLTEESDAPDWVSRYGCDVGPIDRLQRTVWVDVIRPIKAFTIADVYRVVETEHGDIGRKPIHRVLELRGDKIIELFPCSMTKPQSEIDREIAILRELGLWKE